MTLFEDLKWRGLIKDVAGVTAGSAEQISDVEGILNQRSESDKLKDMWRKYQKTFAYANDISYEDVLEVLRILVF